MRSAYLFPKELGRVLRRRTSREYIFLAALIIVISYVGLGHRTSRGPLASSETRFVEHSPSGMQIVPASCPSDPHYDGECSGSSPPASTGCNLVADPKNIHPGQSSTLTWNTGNSPQTIDGLGSDIYPANTTISPDVGPVALSGATQVRPTQTTIYTMSGDYCYNNPDLITNGSEAICGSAASRLLSPSTFSCWYTIAVSSPFKCSDGKPPQKTLLTSGSTWSVPSDWNSTENAIEVIGGGGGGEGAAGAGGGGGAYSKSVNVALTPGTTVSYHIGEGGVGDVHYSAVTGTGGGAGGDTYFCNSTSNCSSISGAAVVAGAQGGSGGAGTIGGTAQIGGTGGNASAGIGNSLKYNGGTGGGSGSGGRTSIAGGGGGGAAGPYGNGRDGRIGEGSVGRNASPLLNLGGQGGAGDAGFGGRGGANQSGGSPGTEMGGSGAGGGGGGGDMSNDALPGGAGCLYGAGGGAGGSSGPGGGGGGGYIGHPPGAPQWAAVGASNGSPWSPGGNGALGVIVISQCTGTTTTTANSCRGYYCSGDDLHYEHSGGAQCVDDLIQHCGFGCSGSACLPPPGLTVSISARPSLVKAGAKVQVVWSSTKTSACTVTGNDGGSWTGTSGTETSGPIPHQTTYTLTCIGIDGSTKSAKAVVDVIPKWQEQ